jgi:ABC transporter ATM
VPETKKLQQLPGVPPIPAPTGQGKSPDAPLTASSTPADTTPSGKPAGNKEQRLQDIQIVKRLLPNIWPKGDRATKTRVLVALGLLIGGKVGGDARFLV